VLDLPALPGLLSLLGLFPGLELGSVLARVLLQGDMSSESVLYLVVLYGVSSGGWRRLLGSPKLQIIFHKRATKYRSVLREMTHTDKGSYKSLPPCSGLTLRICYLPAAVELVLIVFALGGYLKSQHCSPCLQ